MHTPTFVWIITLFYEVFKYGDGTKFLVYVGTNAGPLCVKFWNIIL
jgi:hypothetical protein